MNLAEHILGEVIAWGAAIAMIVVVVFLVKDFIGLFRGEVSIGRILVKVLAALILLGIIFAAADFSTFGDMFSNLFSEVVTEENLPDLAP